MDIQKTHLSESFDPVKLVTSPFTGMFWVKIIMFGLGLAFLGMVGWAVYKAYFNPDPTTTQNNQAREIVYHYHQPKTSFGGCASYQVSEYYRDRSITNRTKK